MEDNKTQAARQQQGTGQVMDVVQPPRPSNNKTAVAAAPVAPSPHVEETASPAPNQTAPAGPATPASVDSAAVQKETPPQQPATSPDDKSKSLAEAAKALADEKADKGHNPLAIPGSSAAKKDRTMLLVTAALVVSLTLAGLSIFAYMQTQNNQLVTQPVAETTDKSTVPAEAAEIEEAITEIDESIKAADDDADFAESDLSDEELGL